MVLLSTVGLTGRGAVTIVGGIMVYMVNSSSPHRARVAMVFEEDIDANSFVAFGVSILVGYRNRSVIRELVFFPILGEVVGFNAGYVRACNWWWLGCFG